MSLSPAVILYDANGVAMAVENGVAVPVNTRALIIAGSDGTNSRFLKTASDGSLRVDTTGVTTQPVSAVALPLPAGASTEATLALIKAKTDNIDVALSTRAVTGLTDAQLRATAVPVSGPLTDTQLRATTVPVSGTVAVSNFPGTQPVSGPLTDTQLRATAVPVSAAALPLPSGASTEATLALIKAKTDNIDVALSTRAVTGLTDAQLRATAVPVSNASLPLPAGAATSALQTQPGVDIGDVTVNNAAGAAAVNIQDGGNSITVDGAVTANAGTNLNTSALALEATQSAMSAKLPATLGQKAMAASLAVVLASDQSSIQVTQAAGPGTTPNISFGDVALAAITTAAIRRTAYTEQSANFTGSILSASANDAAAGTGARTVKIFYVDATGATAGTETVTLNGTTPVNLVTATKCFIEKMEVLTVGSTGSNAGIITLKAGAAGAGTTIGTIAATDNLTFWAHHYVVTGKSANVTGILVGSNVTNTAGSCVGFLRAQALPVANQVEKQVSDFVIVAGLDSAVYRSYVSQIQVTGPARITMYVTTATGSAFTYRGSFDAYDA